MTDAITRPMLTLPDDEADWLRGAYGAASVILEYGSGGSTVMAAEMDGKTIHSVESDKDWCAMMQGWFDANPPASTVHLHHADVGPTAKWGSPRDDKRWRRFQHYPNDIWDHDDLPHPDTVLVDGRFRAACFLTVLFRITKPVTLYFDDYKDRAQYHEVERYGAPVEMRGRMARFDLIPTPVPTADLTWIMDVYTRKL